MKQLSVVLFSIFFFCINLNASEIENIINHFKKIENISFSFKQNINEKIEKGNCVVEYPKKFIVYMIILIKNFWYPMEKIL